MRKYIQYKAATCIVIALPCPALPCIKACSGSTKPCARLLMACIQAQAEAQQAADNFDGTETIDSRQGSLSSRRPKTPRCDGGQSPGPSPNARSRKMRKSARDRDLEDGEPACMSCLAHCLYTVADALLLLLFLAAVIVACTTLLPAVENRILMC